ncbi:DUF6252 family protein [Hymenobacter psychrotolerans]|uniref:Uncharacterized protein n=1 Tax=Hymenobacter psychrotolerans DSM 18569 TaxID=1121959 RepID=A0A1M7FVM6_9BACT|nr:DUF6252 family protein [Hymenobacter psychrotolerans]SHM07848.1 hypothetical protein SAMN02746009_03902 [Hymenobacter psychrotolerans DSM 18569]
MKANCLFLALTLLFFAACKKEHTDPLPPATQTGANTAGCYVNGKPFVAQQLGTGMGSVPGVYGGFFADSLYHISFQGTYRGQEASITLFLRRVGQPGTFQLNQTTPPYPEQVDRYCLDHATYRPRDYSREVYVTDAQHTGQVVFTVATRSRLRSSGTFSFTAVSNQDPGRTITITDGRFDIQQ